MNITYFSHNSTGNAKILLAMQKQSKASQNPTNKKKFPRTLRFFLIAIFFIMGLSTIMPSHPMAIPVAIGGGISLAFIVHFILLIFDLR